MEQTNLINSTIRKNLGSVQSTVSTDLQAENNIAKILCSKASSAITNYEALAGELRFSGTVCFCVTYTNELGEFFTLQDSVSFNSKLENENIGINTVPMFKSDVIELKVSSSSDEVKLNATVETDVVGLITDSVNYYVNNTENIITNSNFVNYSTLASNGNLTFNFEENFESKDKINKILFKNADVKILDYSLGTDYFTVEGIVTVNIGYEIGEENFELKHYTNCYKFKEELEKDGITNDGYLLVNSMVSDCEIRAEIVTNEENSVVNMVIPINVNYAYILPATSEVIVDAYSLKNKLNLNIESFKVDGKNISKIFEEKIDGQLIIDNEAPRIIKPVSFCSENVTITNSFKDGDNLILEGVAGVNVIYLEEDENETLNSVIVEVPFSIENRVDDISLEDEITACAIIKDVDVKCKKGKEINIQLELCIKVNAFNSLEEMALTNIVIGEELTPKEACLQIYFAKKGSSLWDISKGLLSKPEQILDQNPNINLPLEADEKIVLFNHHDN